MRIASCIARRCAWAVSRPVRWETNEFYQEDLQFLGEVAGTAKLIGSPVCVAHVLKDAAGKPYHENFEFQRTRFSDIADVLAPHGIKLGLTFTQQSGNGMLIQNVEQLITLVKTIVAKNVGVVVDLFEWHFGGGTPDMLRDLGADRVTLVRANDAAPEAQKDTAAADRHRKLPMTTGIIQAMDWAEALRDIGYEGPLTPFPHPSQFGAITRDQFVKAAAESLDKMLNEATIVEPVYAANGEDDVEVEVDADADADVDVDEDVIAALSDDVE